MSQNFNGDDASDTLGYTPARGVNRPIGDLFRYPWDRRQSGRATAVKTKTERPVKDPYLQELAELMDKCSETQPGGCDACPSRKRCDRWWGGITNETNHGKIVMTLEMFRGHKVEFETRIKPR